MYSSPGKPNRPTTVTKSDRPPSTSFAMNRPPTVTEINSDLTDSSTNLNPIEKSVNSEMVKNETTLNEEEKKLRPLSRRGVKEIQKDNVIGEAPSPPPPSRANPVQTARPPTGLTSRLQGTASRLASARTQRQTSALSLSVVPARPDTQANTTDRLVTQQGLSRAKPNTASSRRGPPNRMIQDKRYYEGLLQVKMREISNEIAKLRKEIDDANNERSTFLVYDKQVKQLATELTELQGKLADYNLCLDKINTGTDIKEVEAEYEALRAANGIEQAKLENVFAERIQVEEQVRALEQQLEKEKNTTERLVLEMSSEMKAKYTDLYNSNNELQQQINGIQEELNEISKQKENLLAKLAESPVKEETAKLQLKILELEERKEVLQSDEDVVIVGGDVDFNRADENFSKQAKKDKAEIESMERAMNKLKDEIQQMQKEIRNLDRDIKDCHSDRYQKYLELRKREETIVAFLSNFEENKNEELNRIADLKEDIVKSLFSLSKHLLTMPVTQAEYDLVNKDLSQIDSKVTTNNLQLLKLQYQQRQLYYKKLEGMEVKLKEEISSLHEQTEKMRSEIKTYENLDSLKEQMEGKKNTLINQKQTLLETKAKAEEQYQKAEEQYNEIQKRLNANETHNQLQALERKLVQSEQNNFALREFVEDKKCEINYEEIKQNTLAVVKTYNDLLITKYSNMAIG